jgi:phosphoribosyl 1,2-cyclic phosphate phosphodiesterase
MRFTFLGTGTSMGVPVAGGFMREQLVHDPRNERTRCSAWIEDDETSIIVDTGPEFRIQSIRNKIQQVDHVLITHEHMDHIGGLDDLRMYNYKRKDPIPVYTTQSAIESIKKRFDYMFGENKYPGSTSVDLIYTDKSFMVNENIKITPLPVKHGELDIYGFRINDLVYLTDVSFIPESTYPLLEGCTHCILSALRWEPEHPTHLTIPQAVEIAEHIGADKTYLIHMNSYVDHEETNQRLPEHIRLAYDQLTFTF